MPEENRKLTTIMFTDMVGYSALSQQNEALALELLEEQRGILRAVFARHQGREIETVGDAFFAEFPSALAGAQCAIDIQHSVSERNSAQSPERQIRVRIGLHLGDAVYRDNHVHGDGVNIAARIEPLATPGGICCSEDVARQIQNKIELPLRKLGKGELKNIRMPVDIYRFVMPGEHRHLPVLERLQFALRRRSTRRWALAATVALIGVLVWQGNRLLGSDTKGAAYDAVLALPKGPSIAVLPFANLSGDPKDEYFADGITEEIITQLTQFRELFVIARNSTFQYKGKAVDIKQIGRELGVKYVLEGSVRKGGEGIRVTGQLIDAGSGAHLWAETYDRKLTASNIIGVQDDITGQVVAKIGEPYGVISRTGLKEARRKAPGSFSSYECVLLARDFYSTESSPAQHLHARDCLERAVGVEPGYVDAWVWLSMMYLEEYRFGYNPRATPPVLDRALKTARQAAELDPSSAMAHFVLALAYYHRGEVRPFEVEADKALALSPNNALILAEIGHFLINMGKADRGVAMTKKAIALNPHHPGWYWANFSNYHYFRGEYEEALAAALKWNDPEFYHSQMHLARAYGQLGRKSEARAAAAHLLTLYPEYPKQIRQDLRRWTNDERSIEHIVEGLRKAGVDIPPE